MFIYFFNILKLYEITIELFFYFKDLDRKSVCILYTNFKTCLPFRIGTGPAAIHFPPPLSEGETCWGLSGYQDPGGLLYAAQEPIDNMESI